MAHKTTRKGGRSWWGKRETKPASNVTRRRDDRVEVELALRLAGDHEFLAEHEAFSERMKAGDAEPGLTADEFAERYLG